LRAGLADGERTLEANGERALRADGERALRADGERTLEADGERRSARQTPAPRDERPLRPVAPGTRFTTTSSRNRTG
jgi:hypothetical protein